MSLGDVASAVGKGLFAGVAGTAAMTVSSTVEAKLRDRGSSSAPADAAGKMLGVQPRDDDAKVRFATVVHWGYGTSWGAARGLLHAAGMQNVSANAAHFALVWGSAQAMLPALDVALRHGRPNRRRSVSMPFTTSFTRLPPASPSAPWRGAPRERELKRGRGRASLVNLDPGQTFPDLDLPDHTGGMRMLSGVVQDDPTVLLFSRGWWCPKEQRHLREVTALQNEFEVAYTRIVVVSVDPPETQSAFRAGLGARFAFLSDAERRWLPRLGLLEETDTLHEPYRPKAFTLFPDLTIHRSYDGYWYWGRPTMEDLRHDMRTISRRVREDFPA